MNNPSSPLFDNDSDAIQGVLQNFRTGSYRQGLELLTSFLETNGEMEALTVIYPAMMSLFEETAPEAQRNLFLVALLEYPATTQTLVNYALFTEREAFAHQLTNALHEQAPENPDVWITKSLVFRETNRMDEAFEAANRAVQLRPQELHPYFWRANLYRFLASETQDAEALNAYNQAFKDYEQILKREPDHLEGRGQRGTLFLEWGDHLTGQDQADEARQQYRKAVQDFDAISALGPELPEVYLLRGRARTRLDQPDQALADFDKALEMEPNWLEALNARGLLHEAMGAYDQALKDYEGLVREAPESPVVYRLRADAHLALGNFEAALADYKKAIELDPAFIDAYLGLARVQALQEQYDLALQAYEQALKIDPENLEGHGQRGSLFLEWGDHLVGQDQADEASQQYQKALQDFEAVIHQVPELPLAYLQRGRTRTRLDQPDQALADFDKVLEIEPNWVDALNERGLLHEAMGAYEQALKDYEGLVREVPESPVVYRLRADAYQALGNYDAALVDYKQAIKLDSAFIDAHLGLAQVQALQEKYDLALQAYEQALKIDPGNLEGLGQRGTLFLEWGDHLAGQNQADEAHRRYEAALQDFEAVIRQVSELPLVYLQRGRTWARLDQPDQALADFDKALEIEPNWVDALNERGLFHEAMGAYDQALKDYEGLVREAPESPIPYRLRADAQLALGNYEGALIDYSRAIELDPKFTQAYLGRADVHENLGNDRLALQDYEFSILLAPDEPRGYFLRGLLYSALGDGYQAIWDIDRALALDDTLPQGYTGRAAAYLKVGEDYFNRRLYGKAQEAFIQAMQDSQEALKKDPADYYAHRSLGLALWSLEDYEAAASSFARAIDGLNGTASALIPELYTYMGETLGMVASIQDQGTVQEQALQSFDDALTGSADSGELSWINYARGTFLVNMKRADEALPNFARAREINPTYPWAYYGQGRAYFLTDQLASAAESFEALLRLPDVGESGLAPGALIGLGLVDEKTGDPEAAQAKFAAVLAENPTPQDYMARARIFNEFEAAAQAEADFQKALALAQQGYARAGDSEKEKAALGEQLAEAYNALAWFYVDTGRVGALRDTFIDYASQAVQYAAHPLHKGNNLDTLGWGYYQLGEFEKAYEHLRQAVELTPHDFVVRTHFEKAREAGGQ